jgi:antitoxin VapB
MRRTHSASNIRSERGAQAERRTASSSDTESEVRTAKLFKHGRSQAVRLPKEFRFPGSEVRIRKDGNAVVLEPMEFDVDAWLARLDSYREIPFMEDGREQPAMPDDDDELSFDE